MNAQTYSFVLPMLTSAIRFLNDDQTGAAVANSNNAGKYLNLSRDDSTEWQQLNELAAQINRLALAEQSKAVAVAAGTVSTPAAKNYVPIILGLAGVGVWWYFSNRKK